MLNFDMILFNLLNVFAYTPEEKQKTCCKNSRDLTIQIWA